MSSSLVCVVVVVTAAVSTEEPVGVKVALGLPDGVADVDSVAVAVPLHELQRQQGSNKSVQGK